MKTRFRTVYCSRMVFEQFKNGQINIGQLLMDADEKLRGGLDHYEATKNQTKVYDRGVNNLANNLIIRPSHRLYGQK